MMFGLGLFVTSSVAHRRASGGTPAPTPTITRFAAPYADDFETPGSLDSRANWDVTGQTGQWDAFGGYLRRTNVYNAGGNAFFGPVLGDFTARIGYDRSGTGEDDQYFGGWGRYNQNFFLWYGDANNYVRLRIDPNNGVLSLSAVVAGASAFDSQWENAVFATSGDLLIQSKAGKLRARLDGQWLREAGGVYTWPFDTFDLTGAVASGNRSGKVGLFAEAWRYAQAQSIELRPFEVSIATIDQFVGRDALSGAGALGGTTTLTGSYAGTPVSWVYRLLDAATLGEVKAWAAMTGVTASGGAWSGGAFLPTGGPYIVEAGWVGSDGQFRGATSVPVVSGIRIVTYGQSNSLGRGPPAPNGYVVNATASSAAEQDGSLPTHVWRNASSAIVGLVDPGRNYETAKVAGAALGKPVGIQSLGRAGVSLDTLIPGGANWSTFTAGVAAGKGVIEAVIWDQGEGDADGAVANSNYASMFLNDLLPGLRTATGNPNLAVLISPVGRFAYTSAPNGYGAAAGDAKREVLRQQYLAIVAGDSAVTFSDSKLGCVNSEDFHYTAAGYVEMSRRAGWSVAKRLGAAVHDGRGPIVTAASRSGAVITLTLALNGATGLTGPTSVATGTVPTPTLGNAVNGFQVSTDNFATTKAISGIAISGSTLVITLAANPGAACKVRSHYGWSYDDTVCFYGTYADTASIPVFPVMAPLVTS